jgi:transcriptional regulator with XRE-family HTH domain
MTAERGTVGARLKFLRVHMRMRQEDLARNSGFSTSYISMLDRGERTPGAKALVRLAKALGVEPAELLREETVPQRAAPHHQRVLDFVREAHLTPRQVAQFIAVGRALFRAREEE